MKPLDVVRSFYKALGRGDAPAALAVLDDAVQWTEAEGFPYSSGPMQDASREPGKNSRLRLHIDGK